MDWLYSKLFELLDIAGPEEDFQELEKSSQALSFSIQTHSLLGVLLQRYTEQLDLADYIMELSSLLGDQWSMASAAWCKDRENAQAAVKELELKMGTLDYEHRESLRRIQLDSEKEIDQLRQVKEPCPIRSNSAFSDYGEKCHCAQRETCSPRSS